MCVNRTTCFAVISQAGNSATTIMQQKQHKKISLFNWNEIMDI